MKHYLNTELKGKVGSDNTIYYPVYYTFSIHSQTYKYRSQIVRRPLSIDEYAKLQEMYKDSAPSTLLDKDREIIQDMIKRSIENDKFIQKIFKIKYNFHCNSVLDILDEVQNSMPITKWNKHTLSAELFAFPDIELLNDRFISEEGFDRQVHYKLKSAALRYHAIRNEKNDPKALMLIYDWLKEDGGLQADFYQFIGNHYDRSERNSLIEYLEKLLYFYDNKK